MIFTMFGALLGMVHPAAAQVGVSVRIGPPPAPLVERIPVAPGAGYLWRPGHWYWNGAHYVWLGGGYVVRPYASAVWIPGHWRQRAGVWIWVDGHWAR
ncbi:MAG: YXWGXW repeat-containing protein [Candidatus Eremiobacteraeota bacterium]|nr:YXWGXW repeat-containing protein [Candidatus Eremiobacteraeota bacterium]